MSICQKKSIFRSLSYEVIGGLCLLLATIFAMIFANSPLRTLYENSISYVLTIGIAPISLEKPLLLWINDGGMAIFFFLIGLELKKEFFIGQFTQLKNLLLPFIGALGGIIVPALIYYAFNYKESFDLQGWAIPVATDIAFALGVLSLFENKISPNLKIFLMSLAIFDDLAAIIIIAFFYTSELSWIALTVFAFCVSVLAIFNFLKIMQIRWYILVGIIMWVALIKSGVHATLSGVVLALFIPFHSAKKESLSPVLNIKQKIHPVVTFFVLPLFAFVNSGIDFSSIDHHAIQHPVSLGIFFGLFVGKQIGVFGFCWLFIQCGVIKKLQDVSWLAFYGVSCLCGIGFTMSLFIGLLAFDISHPAYIFDERVGILLGSLCSGIAGGGILYITLKRNRKHNPELK